jgi:hypothetical protein
MRIRPCCHEAYTTTGRQTAGPKAMLPTAAGTMSALEKRLVSTLLRPFLVPLSNDRNRAQRSATREQEKEPSPLRGPRPIASPATPTPPGTLSAAAAAVAGCLHPARLLPPSLSRQLKLLLQRHKIPRTPEPSKLPVSSAPFLRTCANLSCIPRVPQTDRPTDRLALICVCMCMYMCLYVRVHVCASPPAPSDLQVLL